MAMEGVKVVTIGDQRVGKSCILISYTADYFADQYVPTVFGALVDRQQRVCAARLFALRSHAYNLC